MANVEDLWCATLAFQLIPDAALDAISSVLSTTISFLKLQEALIYSRIISLNIIMAPLLAQRAIIEKALSAVTTEANIINSSVLGICPALGEVRDTIQQAVNYPLSAARRLLSNINRLSAIRMWYDNQRHLITDKINYLSRIQSAIQSVKNTRGAVKMLGSIRLSSP